jgi:hypothetical protein
MKVLPVVLFGLLTRSEVTDSVFGSTATPSFRLTRVGLSSRETTSRFLFWETGWTVDALAFVRVFFDFFFTFCSPSSGADPAEESSPAPSYPILPLPLRVDMNVGAKGDLVSGDIVDTERGFDFP